MQEENKESNTQIINLQKKNKELINEYNNLQKENKKLNNKIENLQNRKKEIALKSTTTKLEVPITKENKTKRDLKKIRIILISIFIPLFVLCAIFSIINLINMKDIAMLILSIVGTGTMFFVNILAFVLTSQAQNKKQS